MEARSGSKSRPGTNTKNMGARAKIDKSSDMCAWEAFLGRSSDASPTAPCGKRAPSETSGGKKSFGGASTEATETPRSAASDVLSTPTSEGSQAERPNSRAHPMGHRVRLSANSSGPAQFYTGGFASRPLGLQALHDHAAAERSPWPFQAPLVRSAGRNAALSSQASREVVARVGIFEGGRHRAMRQREADAEVLAEDTGVDAVWRPKQQRRSEPEDVTLGHHRLPEYCARVGPDSRCFCGFSFIEHSAEARVVSGCEGGDAFAWKKSLGKSRPASRGGFSFEDPRARAPEEPCSRYRYMPSFPSQTSQKVSVADSFKVARGVPAEAIHVGWFAKCRNCDHGHQEHNPETEACPLSYDSLVGSGRFQSAWECTVCNLRWEEHETALEVRVEETPAGPARGQARAAAALRQSRSAPALPALGGPCAWSAERASCIDQLLRENSYGISGKYKDSDHYAHRSASEHQQFKAQMQREDASTRNQEEQSERRRKKQDDSVACADRRGDSVTYVDTSSAYKPGRGSLYGFGVRDERLMHDGRTKLALSRSRAVA